VLDWSVVFADVVIDADQPRDGSASSGSARTATVSAPALSAVPRAYGSRPSIARAMAQL